MRQIVCKLLFIAMSLCSAPLVSCTQEKDDIEDSLEYSRAEQLYYELSRIPTESLFFGDNQNGSRSTDSAQADIHIYTEVGRQYLSTLSQDQFQSSLDSLTSRISLGDQAFIMDKEYENNLRIFNLLGGKEGLDKLSDFAIAYINTDANGDWRIVESMMPEGLNEKQMDVYVGMAVYIDRIARPIYATFTKTTIGDDELCKIEAVVSLMSVGVDIGFDAFLDICTDGAGLYATPEEAAYVGVDLMQIWIDYEICMGRWH